MSPDFTPGDDSSGELPLPPQIPSPVSSSGQPDSIPDEFKTLIDAFAQAVWETDATGQVSTDSPSWRNYTGQSLADWLQAGWVQAVHPEDQPGALHQWQQAIRTSTPMNIDLRLHSPEGNWRWTTLLAAPVRDEGGTVRKWIGVSIDITERALTEESLRKQETRTRIALEAAEMGTWEWNLATDEVFWNEQHFFLFGMKLLPQPMTPNAFLEHVHPDDLERIKALLKKAIEEKVVYEAKFRAVRDDGTVRWMSGYGRITDEIDGRPTRMSGVIFDINARKQSEQALREADRRKDEFLALLAHELRNPLAPLRNTLHLLQLKGNEDDSLTPVVEIMTRQVDHLVRLVDDLLDVSRISQGKIELRRERIELAQVIKDAVEAVHSLYEAEDRELIISLPAGPIYLYADATRLTQVISNLLNNALKFTHQGGNVTLSARQAGGEAVVEVRDDGIGIPADQLDRIFEMFIQADASLVRSQGGLGLGLMLVRQLVELHEGRVEATSSGTGQGSVFTLHLPALASESRPAGKVKVDTKQATAGRRILVIDDNRDAAQTLALLLKIKGNEVHTRYDGREGIVAAEALRPAIIILDISMPNLDGYDTCRLIREQAWGQSMIVIALSGYGQEDDKRRSLEAGFNAHLVKPVDLGVLMRLLSSLLAE